MTTNTLAPPEQIIALSGISWQTYENLLKDMSESRRLRLTYYHGKLEIMVPSPEHERYKKVLGQFIETIADELKIRIEPLGSTTFKRQELVGSEPDECFYIQNINAVKGKKRIDLNQDPPPDLVIEIDITSSSENRLEVYANLGVPEVWRYDGNSLSVKLLENQKYISSQQSSVFPSISLQEISRFLQQVGKRDYLDLVRAFRNWVKSQV